MMSTIKESHGYLCKSGERPGTHAVCWAKIITNRIGVAVFKVTGCINEGCHLLSVFLCLGSGSVGLDVFRGTGSIPLIMAL